MSIVIVGGNECMECQYKNVCKEYRCNAKVFTKMKGTLRNKIGSPDIIVLFTNTMSHKMVRCAISETKGGKTKIIRCHSSSASALKNILAEHVV
ncbi:hypothetical protein SAMN02745248_01776 [Hathewaya proteolytica DSM 3090]|uniref:DUF2325 domain-containing protein n=1 Tax=Hathewaya proteolytica DSM 3090 TaxID=1121331 RepID=A0A1M6PRN1_9CLOT|nr:DUF2325 domain-containing protein [Hathewaya proteolytica]SHK10624.1 hypothetical protein SAMN02745248_01776 [Hathewaya proteolytica DSM 3090]